MIILGDCLDEMKKMDDNSIDYIITDPPYALSFMSKKWDSHLPSIEIWKEALRICKPGAMMACAGAPRTYHRLTCLIEDAGWIIRDCVMHLFGSGFPKSNNFGKKLHDYWHGYGTSLKPAYEPWTICMKPIEGTFVQNARIWGIGGINIDDSRIQMNNEDFEKYKEKRESFEGLKGKILPGFCISPFANKIETKGRWPANIILDEEAAKMLDQQTGISKSSGHIRYNKMPRCVTLGKFNPANLNGVQDSDGASRFFYCAKTSSSERNRGLDELPLKESGIKNVSGRRFSNQDPYKKIMYQNNHPTVKPLSLMKYLIKLLAPPGDPLLLDLFAGSGSTIVAAKQLGYRAVGIEKEQEYYEIARKRIEYEDQQMRLQI